MLYEIEGLEEDKGQLFENLPPGKYKVEITSVVPNEKSDWNGEIVHLRVIEHEKYNNRKLTLPLGIPNMKAETDQEKSRASQDRARIAKLLMVTGVSRAGSKFDTQELMGKRFVAVVNIKKDKNTDQERNNVTDYLPIQ